MTLRAGVAAVLWKDLVIEARAREVVYPMVFFAAVVTVLGSFAFTGARGASADVAAGLLWIALALSGAIGIARVFEREREAETFRALLLSPVPRNAVYLGKLCAVALYMALTALVAAPLCALLFSQPLLAHAGRLAALLALGIAGFSAVGSLLGATLLRARGRDLLLHLLLYPLVLPALLGGARGTAALIAEPADLGACALWLRFLVAFDAVVIVVALWTFEPLAAEG